jgi:hypothetical protein
MFSGAEGSAEDHPAHAELLIDRRGYLRARWIGVPDVAAKRTAEILSDIRRLGEEPDRAPIEEKHAH